MWLGAAVYDLSNDGDDLTFSNSGKAMDLFGRHSLAYCDTGYGRLALHNKVTWVALEEAIVESGILSRTEEIGLSADAENRSGDIYVTSDAVCRDTKYL